MKKVKQIMALAGIILLLALYVIAFVLAFTAHDEQSFRAFIVAIIATVIVPVLIWAYSFIYKLLKDRSSDEQ